MKLVAITRRGAHAVTALVRPNFTRQRSHVLAAGLTTVSLGLGAGLLVQGSSSSAAFGQAAAPPQGQHYLCYKADQPAGTNSFVFPPGVRLVNALSPNGFVPTPGPVSLHCNPTVKIVGTTVFPITNPDWHYMCMKIKAPQPAARTVTASDQFGKGTLTVLNPNILCLPSWKSLTGPPNQTPNQPPGEDHLVCYNLLKFTGNFSLNPAVQVQDEFDSAPVPVRHAAPGSLCVPTEKILPTGMVYPINNPSLYYVCFAVSPTPIINPVYDENQFGMGPVGILKTKSICVPTKVTP